MSQHFKMRLPDTGVEIYMPRKSRVSGYRFGPSIMVHDGICEAWYSSMGDSFEADWLTYWRSTDNGKTWTHQKVVLSPVPNSMDWFSICDPAFIKYGEYYYVGYTSTLFAYNQGRCNNVFVARSKSPTGPFERWTGEGWGQTRVCENGEVCRWIGNPKPLVYYDEDWHLFGAGEPSFVIKDDVLYMIYTWQGRDSSGKIRDQVRLATADITDENWPAHLVHHGVVLEGKTCDALDMVYCDELHKFIAMGTDKRFSEESHLLIYESDDAMSFTPVNRIKVNTAQRLHNGGLSGDEHHHIKAGDIMLLSYAYGTHDAWGCWGTRMHRYDFSLMDEDFYDETPLENIGYPLNRYDDEPEYNPIHVTLRAPHSMRVKCGETVEIPLVTYNISYEMRPAPNTVVYDNYDKGIVTIQDGKLTARKEGFTFVRATLDDLFCEFPVYVTAQAEKWCQLRPYPEKEAIRFVPAKTEYSVGAGEMKQIRGMVTYADHSWFEVGGISDGVTYVNHAPDLFTVDAEGYVVASGLAREGKVTVTCGTFSFDVKISII